MDLEQQSKIQIDIVSAEKQILSQETDRVFVSGEAGELGLAYGHTPLITCVRPGFVRVETAGKNEVFYISGGLLEVQPSTVTVLADTVLRASDIDEAAAIAAQDRAKKALAGKKSGMDYETAMQDLARAAAQIHAVKQLKDLCK